MKKFAAFAISLCLALPMMAVPAFAIDYGTPPTEQAVADKATGVGESADKPASIIPPEFIADINGDTPVYVTDNASLPKSTIDSIKDSDKPITFEQTSGISITIDPGTITASKELSLGLTVEKTEDKFIIEPVSKGDFGLTMEITLPASTVSGMDTSKLRLYYESTQNNIYDYGTVEVSSDGCPMISLTHASKYFITDKVVSGAIAEGQTKTDNTVTVTGSERELAESKKAVSTANDKGTEVKVTKDESKINESKKSGTTITAPQLGGISIGAVVAVAALAAAKKKKK